MLNRTHPVVVEELTPALLTLGQVQKVLQGLLDEGVPIRDLVRIFEALSLRAKLSTDPDGLVEAARTALGPASANRYADNGALLVLTLDPQLEHTLLESVRPTENGSFLALDGGLMEAVAGDVARLVNAAEQRGISPVLACSPALRPPLHRLLQSAGQAVPVLSYPEIAGFPRVDQRCGVRGRHGGPAERPGQRPPAPRRAGAALRGRSQRRPAQAAGPGRQPARGRPRGPRRSRRPRRARPGRRAVPGGA